jgi:hypothetical protein
MTFKFDQFIETVKTGTAEIARQEASRFVDEVRRDGMSFLSDSQVMLMRWTDQLAKGTLEKDDFEFLVKGLRDLAKMQALTEAGLAAAKIDRIRVAIERLIVDSAMKLIA